MTEVANAGEERSGGGSWIHSPTDDSATETEQWYNLLAFLSERIAARLEDECDDSESEINFDDMRAFFEEDEVGIDEEGEVVKKQLVVSPESEVEQRSLRVVEEDETNQKQLEAPVCDDDEVKQEQQEGSAWEETETKQEQQEIPVSEEPETNEQQEAAVCAEDVPQQEQQEIPVLQEDEVKEEQKEVPVCEETNEDDVEPQSVKEAPLEAEEIEEVPQLVVMEPIPAEKENEVVEEIKADLESLQPATALSSRRPRSPFLEAIESRGVPEFDLNEPLMLDLGVSIRASASIYEFENEAPTRCTFLPREVLIGAPSHYCPFHMNRYC
eukprot:GHVN01077145.1.p1 GENE.GHVN01077145.1~~GHVN01077145.1.p1  ORF type:complete len:327 (+),score=94.36 GHVN01077145.1:132-1112(+)